MNENNSVEVTPIQDITVDSELDMPEGTEQPIQDNGTQDYSEHLKHILDEMKKDDELNTVVGLPNGSEFVLVAKVTVGETMIAAAIFLLLSFQVLKWLLEHVWRR